jgi:ribose transport system substrate-binding protein
MRHIPRSKALLTSVIALGSIALFPGASRAEVPASCFKGVDLATLGPTSIVGQGPHGEKAASPDDLKLTEAEGAKIKAGHFKVGISMQTVNLDWSQLQVQGITDTLNKYGVAVTGVASAEYQVDKQIADIENTIQQHPDGIISIPVDFTATAPTYKKVSQAGIKLVFMDSIPTGLKHPEEYAAMIRPTARATAGSLRRSSPPAWRRAARSGSSISASTTSAPTSGPKASASGCRRTGRISR